MSNSGEIQIISDGDGMAVMGKPELVAAFLADVEVGESADIPKGRMSSLLSSLATGSEAASAVAENSGKWLKLDDASAQALKKYGQSFSQKNGLMYGVVRGEKGQIAKHLQFVPSASSLISPAMLTGVAGIMAQVAMEQQMSEITGYLQSIDKKLDAILQDIKDSLLAELEGIDATIDEAMNLRESIGRVTDVSWSNIQGSGRAIARIQSKVLRRLRNLADSLDIEASVGDRLKVIQEAEIELTSMLGALAETIRLQDAFNILALDRVMDIEPEDLETHRQVLQRTRDERLGKISEVTSSLLERIQQAGVVTNSQRIRSAIKAEKLLTRSNDAASGLVTAQKALGISTEVRALEGQSWWGAVRGVRDDTVDAAKQRADDIRAFGERVSDDVMERRIERAEKKLERLRGSQEESMDTVDTDGI